MQELFTAQQLVCRRSVTWRASLQSSFKFVTYACIFYNVLVYTYTGNILPIEYIRYDESRYNEPFCVTNGLTTPDTVGSGQANFCVSSLPCNERFPVLPKRLLYQGVPTCICMRGCKTASRPFDLIVWGAYAMGECAKGVPAVRAFSASIQHGSAQTLHGCEGEAE